jgi:hypothetical protein
MNSGAAVDRGHDASMVDTLRRVFEAGQQVVLDRLDLMRWDASQFTGRAARGAAFLAIAGALLAGACVLVLAAIVVWLQRVVSLPISLLIVAGSVALLGNIALAIGAARTHGEDEFSITADLIGDAERRTGRNS